MADLSFFGLTISPELLIAFFMIIGILIIIAFKYKGKKEPDEYKPVILAEKIDEHFKIMFKFFGIKVKHDLYKGMEKILFVQAYIPLYWDMSKDLDENLKENINIQSGITKPIDKSTELFLLKVCNTGLFAKIKARLGRGFTIMPVEKNLLSYVKEDLYINPLANPKPFFNTIIYGEAGKDYIDDIRHKVNRENELQEIVNEVPKQTYLELKQARQREQLTIFEEINSAKRKEQLEQIKKS